MTMKEMKHTPRSMNLLDWQDEEIERLRNVNRELLEALKAAQDLAEVVMRAFSKDGMWPDLHDKAATVKARAEAIIAKVEGTEE